MNSSDSVIGVRKSLRFPDGMHNVSIPIKNSDKIFDNLINKRQVDSSFNVNVSSTSESSHNSDTGSEMDSSIFKNKRCRNTESDNSKKIKITKLN